MSGWHIQQGGQTKGPYTDEQMKALCEAGTLNASSLVWKSDYSGWKPLAETDFIYKSLLSPPPISTGGYSAAPNYMGQPAEDLSIWQYYTRAIGDKYATFTGRARRKEYWSVVLFYWLFLILIALVGLAIDAAAGHMQTNQPQPIVTAIFAGIYILIMLLPGLALFIRRLHDAGLSGWLILVGMIPYAGWVFDLVVAFLPSEMGTNKHGPYPKRMVA